MATAFQQVDNQTNNGTSPQSIATLCSDGSLTIYICWSARNLDATTGIFFRTYDIATSVLGPVRTVVASGGFVPQMARLTDGRLIIVYQTGSTVGQVKSVESSDEGASWSAPVTIDANVANALGALGADGVTAYLYHARAADCWESVRTGVSTWTVPAAVFVGTGDNTFRHTMNAPRAASIGSARRCVLVDRNGPGSFSSLKVNAFAFDSLVWADVNIFTGVVAASRSPKVHRGTDGVTRGALIDQTGKPYLFRSTNDVDFTLIGNPPGLNEVTWDPNSQHAVSADARDIWYMATTVQASHPSYRVYKGQDSLDGWTRIEGVDIPWSTASSGVGDGLFVGKDFYYLGTFIANDGPAGAVRYHLFIARTEDIGSDPPPPPDPGYTSGRRFQRGTLRTTKLDDGEVAAAPIEIEYAVETLVEV